MFGEVQQTPKLSNLTGSLRCSGKHRPEFYGENFKLFEFLFFFCVDLLKLTNLNLIKWPGQHNASFSPC